MTAAAQTPGLTNPTTGKDCLLAFARWLLVLIFVRLLIYRGMELAATFRRHPAAFDRSLLSRRFGTTDLTRIVAGITRARLRATALEARLLATGSIEAMADIARRHAIAEEINEICAGLGILRTRSTRAARQAPQRISGEWYVSAPAPFARFCPPIRHPAATGPPAAVVASAG